MREHADTPWVIAHRGDHGDAANNSMAAFEAAIHGGFDMIETDLRRCLDGIVVMHDAHVDGRPVSAMSRREIRDGTGILPVFLDDLVERCRGHIRLDLELKEAGLEAEVLGAVAPFFEPEQYLISSFDAGILRTVRNLDGEVRTGLLSARGLAGLMRAGGLEPDARSADDVLALMRACDAQYLIPDALDGELLARGADAGAALILWYVNTEERVREMLDLPSVLGAITDCPRLMRQTIPARAPQ